MDKKEIKNTDTFTLGGKEFTSRFILGSGKFSLDLVKACVEKAGAQIITLALRRANEGGLANILDVHTNLYRKLLRELLHLLWF